MDRFLESLDALGSLADDFRRHMYLFIRAQRRPVGRDEAAQEVGISRKLAAFHLDKLVEKGLLTAHYSRLTGRTGPGAGRPSKLYEPSEIEIDVSIPSRSYELAGEILVNALADTPSQTRDAVRTAARKQGTNLGRQEKNARALGKLSPQRSLSIATEILQAKGYEPYLEDDGSIRLNNCPFHALVQQSVELVCGLNQAFVQGLLTGLGTQDLDALLDPREGECCVRLTTQSR